MRTLSRSLMTVIAAIVIGGVAVGACLAALIPGTVEVATAHHYTAPQVQELKALAQPSQIYWADGLPMGDPIGKQGRQNITSLSEVPKIVQDAVLATEDRSFWTNDGIDLGGVFRAFLTNLTSGKIEQGGSTITQQLVKNRILTSKRDVNRKIKEIEDALRLNEKFSKEKIFVEYLNTVYFGSGSYGIKSAAQRFFYTVDPGAAFPRGKHLDELTIGEAALLAGSISNPTGNNPFVAPDRAIRRRADVLRGMVTEKYITQEQADAANNEPLPTAPPPPNPIVGTDLISTEVLTQLLKNPALGTTEKERSDKILKGGLKIYTTIDPVLQQMAIDSSINAKPQYGEDWVASIVAIDPSTGAVKAMVSGQDYNVEKTNIATSTDGRQTGSTFKVITLAAALMNGYSPEDQVDGTEPCPVPSKFPGVPPEQYPNNSADGAEDGYNSLDHITAHSINCAFVRLATSVGYDKVIATAHAMGITKDNIDVPILSETLGTYGQNTQTMATVMATIANHGVHHTPHVVAKVVAADGKTVIDETNTPGEQALTADVADCEANLMTHVVTGGTGGNAAVEGQQIFGKTGTTDNTSDAWFIGANPGGAGLQLATAVWFGNYKGRVSGAGFGGDSAAPVFRDFMSKALAGQPAAPVPDPGPVCARPGGRLVNPDGGFTAAPVVPSNPSPAQLPTVQQQPTVQQTAPPATTPATPTTPSAGGPRQNGNE
ncbi:MAG TPA: transglycosylase domain-containing protein [Acidimicrobiia bacterium]